MAISGAGPPAMTEANWYPSPAPEYRTFGPKLSAISAACGPYCMSWNTSDSTIASSTSPAVRVFNRPKYGNAYTAVATMPTPYTSRRPIRSDRYPKNGTLISPTAAATRVSLSRLPRANFSCVVPYVSTNVMNR